MMAYEICTPRQMLNDNHSLNDNQTPGMTIETLSEVITGSTPDIEHAFLPSQILHANAQVQRATVYFLPPCIEEEYVFCPSYMFDVAPLKHEYYSIPIFSV
jgi:hypothetical protein